ncbi:ribonuclease H-like domain-containing protein [Tanacetum coccineum]
MPVLQKDDYDTWAMEMEHYLEYIDNEVWKVIQNGNSKKRVTKGKDGVYRVLPPTTQEEQFADEKERKARTLLLMAVPKDHLRRFHGMDDAKEIWAAIKTRFGGNANSKKMQKAVLKQQFLSILLSHLMKGFRERVLPPAWDSLAMTMKQRRIMTTLSRIKIDDLDLEEMDINWQIAMTAIKIKKFYKKTGRRPRVDGKMHVAFDKRKVECFNCHNTGHFARECKFKGSKEGGRQEAGRGQDFKPVRTEKEALMTIDEGQINWVEQTTDEELNHALMAFTVNNEVSMCSKLCLDSFNALQAKYDELQSEFGDQEAALVAHKLAVKKLESQLKASHKQQSSLNEKLNFQANQIFEKDEKLKKYRRIGMKAVKDKDALQKIVDSWFASSKNLWKLIDCGMSSTVKLGLGHSIKSNAEVLGYEEEMSRGIFVLRETDEGYYDIPLYSRFKQVEYKGVPPPLSGDYTPRAQEDIDDSLYVYGKHGPQPQSPSPTVSNASSIVFSICPSNDSDGELGVVSDASSTHYSTCQSNDSDGELGTVTDHSVNDDSIPIPSSEQVSISTQKTQSQVPTPPQTVDPSCAQHVKTPRQPIRTPVTPSPIPSYKRQNWNQRMERELGAGYSFERKPCFVCGSLSHLIKNCDYYEKKMAREAALKSKRVVHADVRQATPAWTNTNRVNKANQFTPRPVQLNNIRPNLSTASNTIKTGRVNANTGHGNVSSVSSAGTQFKSGASRFNTGKQHVNSGSMRVNSVTQFKSGASRINTGNKHINTARVNRPVSNRTSPKPSQVNFNSQNKCFSKQSSPINRPFSRNTTYKSNIYAVKGKMGTAVKTSAGCVWRKTTPLSNTNSGPTPDSYVHDHPLKHMEHRGIFDSGCSGHMTGNRAYLEDYQELSKAQLGHEKGHASCHLLIGCKLVVSNDVVVNLL